MKTKFYMLVAALLIMHTLTSAQYVREYVPGVNVNLKFNCIAKAQDGNYFIAGLQDSSVYVSEVKFDGTVVREKLVGVNNRFYNLTSMIVDADGNIVIVGYINPASLSYKGFLMKLTPALSVILHVTYTNSVDATQPILFTDVKDYKTTGANSVNNAYYVSGYNLTNTTGNDAVLMRLDRVTGASLTTYTGQPNANSTTDTYDALLLDTSGNPGSAPSIFVAGRLSSGGVSTFRPWITKHNIATLAFTSAERYLEDITQTARLYNASITRDIAKNNILYCWYGNLTGIGYPKAIGMTSVNANTLSPVFQKQYGVSPVFQNFIVLSKVETDANGYVAHGQWWDSASAQGEIFLIRTDKAGVPKWARQYKNVLNDIATHNSSFLIDGANIYAIGYKIVAGIRRGVLIKTDTAYGKMDTVCAKVLAITMADSSFAKTDNLTKLALSITPKSDYYPIDCIATIGTKPCDTCINKVINFNGGFTLSGLLSSGSPTFTLTASAYSNLYNSQFVVRQVNPLGLGYPDITSPNTVCTATGWGSGTTTNFPGYVGTNVTSGTAAGVFNAGSIYRIRHIMSAVNNCGLLIKDTVSQLILIAPGFMATHNGPFIILNEGSTVNLSSFITPQIDIFLKKDKGTAVIYPNPANASISFNAAALATPGLVLQVVNGNGQKISAARFTAKGQLTVNTATMASGLYLYTITSNGKTVDQGKFIIQH